MLHPPGQSCSGRQAGEVGKQPFWEGRIKITPSRPNLNQKPACPLCGCPAKRRMSLVHTEVWRCIVQDCGLCFAAPQPSQSELNRAYVELYYPGDENVSEVLFENTPHEVVRQVFRHLAARLGDLSGKRLLDYGCGRGHLLRVGIEHGMRPNGIEPDSNARAAAARLPHARIYGSLAELASIEGTPRFDFISLWTVIEHLREPWKDLRDLRSVLSPNGWLLITTMDIRCLRARIERGRWANYANPTHLYYFDRTSLKRTIRAAGFHGCLPWKVKVRYPAHGFFRRSLYNATFRLGLSDGLFFLCKGPSDAKDS